MLKTSLHVRAYWAATPREPYPFTDGCEVRFS